MLRLTSVLVAIFLFLALIGLRPTKSAQTLRQVTHSPEQAFNLNPILSDDGQVIVFESTADLVNEATSPSFHTYRANVINDASIFQEIARSRSGSPSLSSDGNKIAFASTEDLLEQNPDRNSEIYFFDGLNLRQLTRTSPDSEISRLRDGSFAPSISSDGRRVAFLSNRIGSAEGVAGLFLYDTASRETTQLTINQNGSILGDVKLSGNGTRLYFIRSSSDGSAQLMFCEVNERSCRILLTDVAGLSFAAGRVVSADGNRVVYSAITGPNQTQVFMYDLRRESTQQLTQLGARTSEVPLNATISGDGKRVAFATRRRVLSASDGSVELYIMDLPTGTVEQVTNAPTSATGEVNSSLNHDGSAVAFSFPQVLTEIVNDSESANNSEIYFASLNPRPDFGEARVTNAAASDFNNHEIASESIALIRGRNLCDRTIQAKSTATGFPLSISGTTVSVSGQPARILFASPSDIIFVVPPALPDGPAEFVVTNSEGFPAKASGIITRTAPGVFNLSGKAVALNGDTFATEPFDPTNGELRLILFATGIRNASQVAIKIGDEDAVVETVLPSSLPGLDEIHIRLPEQLRGSGNVSVGIFADGVTANSTSVSINGSSLRDIMINEILVDPPDGVSGDANHDGARDSAGDEFVELVNSTTRDLDLSGYQLSTKSLSATNDTLRHRFSQGTHLHAGTAIVVFGGGNINGSEAAFQGAQVIRASSGSLALVNSGGVVTLRNSLGSTITSISYGASRGLPADINQSITRAPDINGNFVPHQSVAASLFSPGARFDGGPFNPNPSVSTVVISPTAAELLKGTSLQFSARAFGDLNQELGNLIFSWQSSNASVLTIDANGRVSAVNAGSVQITASARGVHSAPAIVNVVAPTPTPTPTPVPSPSPTPTPSPSPSPTVSPSPTPSPTPSPSPTPNPTPTPTPSPSPTPTASPSPTPVPSPTATPTPLPSPTPTPSQTPMPTPSPSPSPTATPTPTPSVTPTPLPTPTPNLPLLVISEFRTRGPNGASDEFVEIYNNSDLTLNAGGLKIRGSSSTGTITTRLTINANTFVPARGHFLATNSSGYSLSMPGDQTFTSGFANDGGIALTTADDLVIDQVGLSTGSAFKEGTNLSPLASDTNQSYERKPGGNGGSGQDTNNNTNDFQLINPSDPQNLASSPTPGPTPSPSPTPGPSPTPTPSPSPSPSPTPTPSPSPSPSPSPTPTPVGPATIVLSQVYGGGGNSGAPLRNDFIELFNAGTSAVNLSGWSVQYSGATAATWNVTLLPSAVLAPGQYFLIQEASGGTTGSSLPAPDVIGTINLAATAGKIALVHATSALTGSCPSDPNIVDLVGYGNTASCFEGVASAVAPSNTNAIVRGNGGCSDTNNNAADFTIATPNPRNNASVIHSCSASVGWFGFQSEPEIFKRGLNLGSAVLETGIHRQYETSTDSSLRLGVRCVSAFRSVEHFNAEAPRTQRRRGRKFNSRDVLIKLSHSVMCDPFVALSNLHLICPSIEVEVRAPT